jgi:hypothetical protein
LNRPSFDESRVRTATCLDPGRAGSKNRYQCRGSATGGLLPVAGGEIGDRRRVEAAGRREVVADVSEDDVFEDGFHRR